MGVIINGREISKKIRLSLKNKVIELNKKGKSVTLAVLLVGDDPASKLYVENKRKACEELGIISKEYLLPYSTSGKEIICLIQKLNNDNKIDGILVQLPLPNHINTKKIVDLISVEKDVDAFCKHNVGSLFTKDYKFLPCTPSGILEILKYENIDLKGKHCVILGRSNVVGKPLALLLLENDATVTICHSKTNNLKDICKMADIIIAAVGSPKFLTKDMVKEGAVIIDVGINRDKFGKICGDVDFENLKDKASYITPVPGGVGPMTVTMLMKNVILAAEKV